MYLDFIGPVNREIERFYTKIWEIFLQASHIIWISIISVYPVLLLPVLIWLRLQFITRFFFKFLKARPTLVRIIQAIMVLFFELSCSPNILEVKRDLMILFSFFINQIPRTANTILNEQYDYIQRVVRCHILAKQPHVVLNCLFTV